MTRYSHVSRVADQNGRARSLFYDGFGRLVREVDDLLRQGAGNERVFTRDAAGHVTRLVENVQKDLGGSYQVVSYRSDLTYNEWDQLLTVQRFGTNATVLATERRAYDSLGNLVRGEDGAGKVTDGSFDGLGRLLDSTRNPRPGSSEPPVITTISRDDAPGGGLALVVTRQDGLGNSSVYEYDLAGRLVTRKLPGWQAGGGVKTWSYTYDTEGRLLSRIDGNGAQVRIGYDANKRPEKRWLAMPGSQTLSLNCTNETFAYDVLSRLYRGTTWQGEFGDATGPSPNAQTFVRADRNRDVFGRITSEVFGWGDDGSHAPLPGAVKTIGSGWTDGSGSEDFGFRRSRTTPSGFTMTFTPDAAGKPTQVALSGPNGLNLPSFASYRYEGGRLLRRDVNSAGGNDRVWATYGYDALGYLTAIDVRYGPGQPTDPGRYSLSVTRDIIGNVLDERYTKVSGKLGDKFTLDGFDRLQTAELGVDAFTGSPNADTRIDYALDAAHNRTTVTTTPGGTDTYSRIPNTNEYQDVNGVPYVQDGNGNLVGDGFYVYVYDYLDRLSEVYLLTYPAGAMVGSGASAKLVYPTSAEQKARTGVSSRITAKKAAELIAGARKRVDAHYSKWQRGGLDPKVNEGLQAATGEPALEFVAYYGYDIANRRVWKLTLAENTNFAWDGWTVADEFDGAWQETKSRFTPAGIGSEVGYAVQSGGTWTRYTLTANHLGSIVQVTDANGQLVETYEYDAYGKRYVFDAAGNPLADTQVANDRGFALHVHDPETGLVYMRNRYYSLYLGRLLTTDRLGVWNDPFGWGNAYAYAGSRPQSMLDALGDETWIIGGVAFDVRVGVPGPASGVSTLTATLVTVDGVPMTRQQFMGLIGAGMQDPLPVEDRLVAATVGVITSAGVELSFNGTIRDAYRATASGFRHNGTSVARAWLRRTQQGRMFPFSRSLLLRDLRGAGTRPLPFRNELARAHRLCLGNPTKTRPGVDRLARKLRFAGRLMLLAGAVTAAIELAGSDNKGRTGASLFGAAAGGALGGWGAAALVSGLATGPVAPAVLGVATLLGLFGGGSLGAGGSEALYDSVFIRR